MIVESAALFNILYLNLDQLTVQSGVEPQGQVSSLFPAALPYLCYARLVWGHFKINVLTGCGGQIPKRAACSRRSLRLVWIFTRRECEGQGAGDTFSKPTEN